MVCTSSSPLYISILERVVNSSPATVYSGFTQDKLTVKAPFSPGSINKSFTASGASGSTEAVGTYKATISALFPNGSIIRVASPLSMSIVAKKPLPSSVKPAQYKVLSSLSKSIDCKYMGNSFVKPTHSTYFSSSMIWHKSPSWLTPNILPLLSAANVIKS